MLLWDRPLAFRGTISSLKGTFRNTARWKFQVCGSPSISRASIGGLDFGARPYSSPDVKASTFHMIDPGGTRIIRLSRIKVLLVARCCLWHGGQVAVRAVLCWPTSYRNNGGNLACDALRKRTSHLVLPAGIQATNQGSALPLQPGTLIRTGAKLSNHLLGVERLA